MNFLTKALQTKIGGQSTPMVGRTRMFNAGAKAMNVGAKAAGKAIARPVSSGSNAQREAYGKAMNSAYKSTKTFK
ncbi:MAG: hypothetical protein WC822_06670 [Candidatus Paceibacterota bacterium]|jgi:hypothetical protein